MAKLSLLGDDTIVTHDFNQIKAFLATEGIEFGKFDLNKLSLKKAEKLTLDDAERLEVIKSYPDLMQKYANLPGYRADMICLYPEFQHIEFVLSKFKDVHFHYENEHWYYIDGSSGFGFLGSNGIKFTVEIFSGEHITVPEGKWQWVIPPENRRMKAIRFFNCTETILKPTLSSFV